MERSTLIGKENTRNNNFVVRSECERNRIAEKNRALVPFVLNRYFKGITGPDRDDAEAEGYIGLLKAAERWDASIGPFSTYACRWIFGYVKKQGRLTRREGFGGVSRNGVPLGTCLSMETPLGSDSSGVGGTVADRIADPDADIEASVTDAHERAEQLAIVWSVARRYLVPRQADILRLHYREGLTFDEIAARRGEPRRNIHTGHANALKGLRAAVQRDKGAAFARY